MSFPGIVAPLWDNSQFHDQDFFALFQQKPYALNNNYPTYPAAAIEPQDVSTFSIISLPSISEDSSPSQPGNNHDDLVQHPALKRKASNEQLANEPSHKAQHSSSADKRLSTSAASTSRRKSMGSSSKDEHRLLKRKEQIRAAQRALEERKKKHVKDLEDKIAELEAQNEAANNENGNLRDLSGLQNENKQSAFTFSVPMNSTVPSFTAQTTSDATTSSKPTNPLDWSSLTTFDPNMPNHLDDNVQANLSGGSLENPGIVIHERDLAAVRQQQQHDQRAINHSQIVRCRMTTRPIGINLFNNSANNHLINPVFNITVQCDPSPAGHINISGITLVDATGMPTTIPMEFCISYKAFDTAMKLLLKRETMESRIQRQYVDAGMYDFCVEHGDEVSVLNGEDDWTIVQPGTKVTMRVVLPQKLSRDRHRSGQYQCPRPGCGEWNDRKSDSNAMDCRGCLGRFQVTNDEESVKSPVGPSAETMLLRNFHLKQYDQTIKNIDVSVAWRTILADPKYKDVDINDLCQEFTSRARCDGTEVVLEPADFSQILDNIIKSKPASQ